MKLRLLLATLILIAAALLIGRYVDRQRILPGEGDNLSMPDNIDYYLSQVDYRAMNDQGRLNYHLRTPHLEHYIREDISRIEQPELELFSDQSHWSLQSGKGTLQHQQEQFELTRAVVLKRQSPRNPVQLNTSEMQLLARVNIVHIPQPLTLKTPTLDLQADSARIHLNRDQLFFSNVKATYQTSTGDS